MKRILKVNRPHADILELKNSRPRYIRSTIVILVVVMIILSIPQIIRTVKISIFGKKYLFDSNSRCIKLNDKIIAGFEDIERVELNKITDEYEVTTIDYDLLLIREKNKNILIENFSNYNEAHEIAESVSKY